MTAIVEQLGPETRRTSTRRGPSVGAAALAVASTMVMLAVIAALAIRSRNARAAAPGIDGETLPSLDASQSEVSKARVVRGRGPGTVFFLAELSNAGAVAGLPPRAAVTFFDAQGRVVGSGSCDSPMPVVRGGERVPCAGQIDEVGAFESHRVDLVTSPAGGARPLQLPAGLVRILPPTDVEFGGADVAVTNPTSGALSRVRVVVTLRDEQGGVVGLDHVDHESPVAAGSTVTLRVPVRLSIAPAKDHGVAAWSL